MFSGGGPVGRERKREESGGDTGPVRDGAGEGQTAAGADTRGP